MVVSITKHLTGNISITQSDQQDMGKQYETMYFLTCILTFDYSRLSLHSTFLNTVEYLLRPF